MNTTQARLLLGAFLTVAALTLTGCLDRTEKITVAEDGSAAIEVEFDGDARVLESPLAFPSAPEWTILEKQIDSSSEKPQLKMQASVSVPYGSPLPESFANRNSPDYDSDLQFPGRITVREEGNRTYYEFRRSYKARRLAAYDLTANPDLWDADLEKKVVDSGLLNVSEQDRNKYLEQLTAALNYSHWRINREALAHLAQGGLLEPTLMDSIAAQAALHFEATLTPHYLLGLMQESDETITLTLDSLDQVASEYFQSTLAESTRGDSSLVRRFVSELDRVRRDCKITEVLGDQNFTVELHLPGTVLTTNGTIQSDELGKVAWFFKGDKLHDADFPLYAISVVTR